MIGENEKSIFKIVVSRRGFALSEEVDGIRFISNKRNQILRKIPDYYLNIY